jgi:hypothetical protein
MAVAALAFRTALGNDLTPPVRLTGTVGAGGVVYLASMVFIFRERFLTWLTEYA